MKLSERVNERKMDKAGRCVFENMAKGISHSASSTENRSYTPGEKERESGVEMGGLHSGKL